MNFFLLAFVFSRENRRPKGAKFKYIFESEGMKTAGEVVGLHAFWRAHLGQVVRELLLFC